MHGDILIRGVNWVGDAVMTMPAIRAIKMAAQDGRVSLLVKPWVAPLFENSPDLDDIILYDDRYKGISGIPRLAGDIRAMNFDQAILLQNAFEAALIAWLARIPKRVGYSRDMRGLLLTDPVPLKKADMKLHHIDYYIELLRRAGIETPKTEPWIYLRHEERIEARERLSTLKRPVIGINPGAAYGSAKQWLPKRFSEVAKRVVDELDGSVVLFGGPAEKSIADEIFSLADVKGDRISSTAGSTTLRELASLISECDLLLTNDSGPMHVCYAVKTPLVAVFGSTDPVLTGPPKAGSIVIKKNLECSPCFLRRCPKKGIPCMEAVSPDEVFKAIEDLLPRQKAVFFDRDGTICEDAHFLNRWDDLKVFPDIEELRKLKSEGFKLIGISNQSGIGRGIVDESFAVEVNDYFVDKHGFDAFYYCPHHPEDGCSCRKPSPEMLFRARADHGVDLKQSFFVGDRDADMLIANAVGAKAILVQTGKQKGSEHADFVVPDLKEAVRLITSGV